MAIWLVARACGAGLPRRLVYVVDRRAVVDQATDFAEDLRKCVDGDVELKRALGLENRSLPISTLRGQHVDNKKWLEDPASAAIVVGTVDMVGSRLLFEGYGTSRRMAGGVFAAFYVGACIGSFAVATGKSLALVDLTTVANQLRLSGPWLMPALTHAAAQKPLRGR